MIYIHEPAARKIRDGGFFFVHHIHNAGWIESIVLHDLIHFDGCQLAIATEHVAQSLHGALWKGGNGRQPDMGKISKYQLHLCFQQHQQFHT